MSRLVIVSNRLPVRVVKEKDGIIYEASPGGLASGLSHLPDADKRIWIGWPGISRHALLSEDRETISTDLGKQNCHPVFLSDHEIENYYHGFSNNTIWPLFHYFPLYTTYDHHYWQVYQRVNRMFCDEVINIASDGDCIWIHDYQLMLLPQMIREALPNATIGFFLHIPFPSYELFRLLPQRMEIIKGILGSDLVGFHTYDYVRHFLSSVCRLMGVEHTLGELSVDNRIVKADVFPMGIDYDKYSNATTCPEVQKHIIKIREQIKGCKTILSIDRLDYTKGILQRLEAFDSFLHRYPEHKGKVMLIVVAVPSRTGVDDYVVLKDQLEGLVGKINGTHGAIDWMPIWYLYQSLPFEELTALYAMADVALVTPLRDGMNLIAKEFVATRNEGHGVLIISEMAGAASELGESLIINANDKESIVSAIKQALEMPQKEQELRNHSMQKRLRRYTISRWAQDFLETLSDVKTKQSDVSVSKLTDSHKTQLYADYQQSENRLFLLDYDGTLKHFVDKPDKAEPDLDLHDLIDSLAKDLKNDVVIISGRDRQALTQWLGGHSITLIAEHGAWVREKGAGWQVVEPLRNDWKEIIRPILELYVDRTPGSSIEEKDYSIVWHCRRANPELAKIRSQELRAAIANFTENLEVGVFEGNKILEVKNLSIHKGYTAKLCLARKQYDFILAAGDDYTDEDMFAVLPDHAYSIKVRPSISKARFNVDSVDEMRNLLEQLLRTNHVEHGRLSTSGAG